MAMPTEPAYIEYEEVTMLVEAYAKKLSGNTSMSYNDLLRTIDKLTALGEKARKLWGDR